MADNPPLDCKNCGHPNSDHVTMVVGGEKPVVTSCYFPVHRNYDCQT